MIDAVVLVALQVCPSNMNTFKHKLYQYFQYFNIGHFNNHKIIFDTTLCGDWAGNAFSSCSKTMKCSDFVRQNPSEFTEAYWLVNYVDIYDIPKTVTKSYVGCFGKCLEISNHHRNTSIT